MAPPNGNRKRKIYSEESLRKALSDIREKKKGIREACRLYGVPKTTIQNRLSGKTSDALKTSGPDPVLGKDFEKQIVEWVIRNAKCGFLIKKQALLDEIQIKLKDNATPNPFKDSRPGQTWYLRFLKRHPEVARWYKEANKKAKAKLTNESISQWFQKLSKFLKKMKVNDILDNPERIFNGHVCNFAMCTLTGEIAGPNECEHDKYVNEENKILLYVILNAIGKICSPLIGFPSQVDIDNAPPNFCLFKTECGRLSNAAVFEYVTNNFSRWIEGSGILKPVLLLLDAQKTPLSLMLNETCKEMGIILYALPCNASRTLLPVEICLFAPLREHWYGTDQMPPSKPDIYHTNAVTINKFCQLLRAILQDDNVKYHIVTTFENCGLFPFNPQAMDFYNYIQKPETAKITVENQIGITSDDIQTTRKVLKHLRKRLHRKNVNVSVILKVLRKIKETLPKLDDQTDYDSLSSASADS